MDLENVLESLQPGMNMRLTFKDREYLILEVGEGQIDIKILDLEGVKSLIPKKDSKKRGIQSIVEVAKSLEEKEFTLNVFSGDKMVLRLGKDAKPGLLTFLGPIQVTDLKAVTKMLG